MGDETRDDNEDFFAFDDPKRARPQQVDLFTGEPVDVPSNVTRLQRRIMNTAADLLDPPDEAEYLHAVLCQVGMPRNPTPMRVFERKSGNAIMVLEAGKIMRRGEMVDQPLPYGSKPRLVMVHLSTYAIKNRTPEVVVGNSMREFLRELGIDTSGGARGGYTMFKKQMQALASCKLTLGFSTATEDVTINTTPIRRFEAWLSTDGKQRAMWPGVMELSQDFYETLVAHAVPLDPRALGALKHSALALDIYTWLAHRLCRIRSSQGVRVYWANLRQQFGQEYNDPRNFKRKFVQALTQVLAVYPSASVEQIPGGLLLKPSPPPIPKTQVLVQLPRNGK
ncbi:MAG: hypothetical protein QOJ59_598 [Thermomicrobiales bacterium]|jgi:hypothetical protein|nr:hypothetical protein [Thermomicrobiales bacterium]